VPRAYRPRLSTLERAAWVARLWGATSWRLYRPGPHRRGPITMEMTFGTRRVTAELARAEQAIAAGVDEGVFI
jgi:hypothetical protein